MKSKDACSLEQSYDQPREHIKKKRYYFADKCQSSQSYGFSNSHVWMWKLDYKTAEKVKVKLFSHVQLFGTPMDYSLSGFSVHRIFQARVPEWVAISFSRGSSRDRTQVSHIAGRHFTIWASFIREAHEKKSQLKQQTSMLSYLKNCQTCPSATTTLISQQTSHWGKTLYQQKHYDSLKTQMMFIIFQQKTFFFFFIFWRCGAACRILVPQPGIEPVTTAVDVWSPNHWTTGD